MTRLGLILASVSLILSASASAAPATGPSDLEKETAALKEKVAALEARVKTLERELRDARSGGRLRIVPAPTTPPTPQSPGTYELPRLPDLRLAPSRPAIPGPAPSREQWEHRDINGIRFYLVPLQQDSRAR